MTARIPFKTFAQDGAGNGVSGMAFEVREKLTSAHATLYAGATGATEIGNPGASGTGGEIAFYVDPGLYTVTVGAGGSAETYDVPLLWAHGD